MGKRFKIIYFSGTGGTRRIAECFEKRLKEIGAQVTLHPLREGIKTPEEPHDYLILLFAEHALNAPLPVYRWIESREQVAGIPAAVFSVSGGGEVCPNRACRAGCIKKLTRKGYDVTYEEMFVMPSNFIVAVEEALALTLLEIMPLMVNKTIDDLISGVHRRIRPKMMDRFLSHVGELEKLGVPSFGKRMQITNQCNHCGWCEKSCPMGNIRVTEQGPVFDKKCIACLGCVYGCHKKALKPKTGKFMVLRQGYSLEELEKKLPYQVPDDIESKAKGYAWSGIKKYIIENKNLIKNKHD